MDALVDDFFGHQSIIAHNVLAVGASVKSKKAANAETAITYWIADRGDAAVRTDQLLTDLKTAETVDLAMLTVANGKMRSLI